MSPFALAPTLAWLVPTTLFSVASAGEHGFTNAVFSGLTTRALARVIERLITDHPGLAGLYHVSATPISKFDLLTALRDALGISCEIRPVAEPRINRALDSTRFHAATGIEVPSWSAMIGEYRQGEVP